MSIFVGMNTNSLPALFACLIVCSGQLFAKPSKESAKEAAKETGKISLFNGKDLSGWHADIPDADKNPKIAPSFIVRDGKLVSMGQPRGHLITDAVHENYRLELEYRFATKSGNCGVLIHASTLRARSNMFPKSVEVQMQHKHAGDFWVIEEDIRVVNMEARRPKREGQKYGGGQKDARRIINLTDDSEKLLGEWNKMIIEAKGNEIKVWLNGDLVNHGTHCTVSKGKIALQAEGVEVEFKNLYLNSLKGE
jgi:hypothetical protein